MNDTTNWNDIRIRASISILSGIVSNPNHPFTYRSMIKTAVEMADFLIEELQAQIAQ